MPSIYIEGQRWHGWPRRIIMVRALGYGSTERRAYVPDKGTCRLIENGALADNPSFKCYSCSKCSFGWHHSTYDKQFSYCPNCGAEVIE